MFKFKIVSPKYRFPSNMKTSNSNLFSISATTLPSLGTLYTLTTSIVLLTSFLFKTYLRKIFIISFMPLPGISHYFALTAVCWF